MRLYFLTFALLALIGKAEAQPSSQTAPPSPGSMLYGATVAVTPTPADVVASDAYKVLIADLRQGGYVIYLRHAMTATTPEPAVASQLVAIRVPLSVVPSDLSESSLPPCHVERAE